MAGQNDNGKHQIRIYLSIERGVYVGSRLDPIGLGTGRSRAVGQINGNTLGFGANFLFRDNWFRHTLVESGSEAELVG